MIRPQATSLYTREAYYRPTVHLKSVTHYTLQGKACEKEYEQIVRTPFVLRQVKPALWKAPLHRPLFFVMYWSRIAKRCLLRA